MRTPGAAAAGVRVPAGVPLTAILLAGVVVAAPCTAQDTPTARAIVASGELARRPNPVLLAFLLEDCSDCLPADVRQAAIDQMIASLRDRTLIDPMEQVGELMRGAMGMMSPAAMMKQALSPENMLRGALGAGPGGSAQAMQQRQLQGMQDALLDPWVRGLEAADNLRRAGHDEAAADFYRGCLTSIGSIAAGPMGHDWIQDRCIDGALALGPETAGEIFAAIWDEPYPDFGFDFSAFGAQGPKMEPFPAIQAVAAKALGKLVGGGDLETEQRDAVMGALLELADTRRLDPVAATGVVQGLAFAADRRAQPVLDRLAKRGKPEQVRPVAVRALAAAFRDEWAVGTLRKELQQGGGVGKAFKKARSFVPGSGDASSQMIDAPAEAEDDVRHLAASVLLRIGDEAGYTWTDDTLKDRNPPQGETDARPDLVRDLVETGSERARRLLAARVAAGHPNEWLLAWMRIGLYELGDRSQLDELAALIDETGWDFGRGTAASWYKRLEPLLWEGAKLAMGMPSDTERLARMVASFAFAERDRHLQRADERARRTAQFRWQLADALAGVDSAEAVPVLARLLEFDDESVRLSAASALLSQSSPPAADLLARALDLDYGDEDGVSRNSEIHAALVRALVSRFRDHPRTAAALSDPRRLDDASVALMVLAVRSG